MVTDETRIDVWQEYLDVARLVRYYEALAKRYNNYQRLNRLLLILPFLSGVALVFDIVPNWLLFFIGILIAVVVAIDFCFNFAKKAVVLQSISVECSKLEIEWRELWAMTNSGTSDDEIRRINKKLAKRLNSVTSRAGDVGIHENKKLNEKCEEDAYRIMNQKYVSST